MLRAELEKLPYVDVVPSDGRSVIVMPFWNENLQEWMTFLEVRKGELGRIAGGQPVIGTYLARNVAEAGTDLEIPLATFVVQRLSFTGVHRALEPIISNVRQMAAISKTFQLIELDAKESGHNASLLAVSQLEHLIVVMRSTYDLIQRFVHAASAIVKRADDPERNLIKDLPDSFARVVLDGDRLRSSQEIAEKFSLTPGLAAYYAAEGKFFQLLRDIRVGLEHYGRELPHVYALPDDGFAVPVSEKPWRDLSVWEDQELRNENRFGAFRAVYTSLMIRMLEAINSVAPAYLMSIAAPDPLYGDLRVFLRHPYGAHLVGLEHDLKTPWRRSPAPGS